MYPPQIAAIRRERENLKKRRPKAVQWNTAAGEGLLLTKTANDWMKQEFGKPAAKPLFGSLWFGNELCILFAGTNMGKSVLAVQIADSPLREWHPKGQRRAVAHESVARFESLTVTIRSLTVTVGEKKGRGHAEPRRSMCPDSYREPERDAQVSTRGSRASP